MAGQGPKVGSCSLRVNHGWVGKEPWGILSLWVFFISNHWRGSYFSTGRVFMDADSSMHTSFGGRWIRRRCCIAGRLESTRVKDEGMLRIFLQTQTGQGGKGTVGETQAKCPLKNPGGYPVRNRFPGLPGNEILGVFRGPSAGGAVVPGGPPSTADRIGGSDGPPGKSVGRPGPAKSMLRELHQVRDCISAQLAHFHVDRYSESQGPCICGAGLIESTGRISADFTPAGCAD